MSPKSTVPKFDQLINPTLKALHKLGGSASIQEMVDEIINDLGLPESVTEIQHKNGNRSELEYRAAWARTYLKNYGLVENSERGIWALTKGGRSVQSVDARDVVKAVRDQRKQNQVIKPDKKEIEIDETDGWRLELLNVLQAMDPGAFERLCQRILREAGFIEVEVTGRTGDGGIDGYGTIRIGGLISFNVLFQSKRYKGSIGAGVVRDFRGAMVGRADKGLLITTGTFTREARKEATRDGAPPLDLIDGELLLDKLKELRLGVEVKMVESVQVKKGWFDSI